MSSKPFSPLWRSENMSMIQMFVQYDAAHDTVEELGELGVIQFTDVSVVPSLSLPPSPPALARAFGVVIVLRRSARLAAPRPAGRSSWSIDLRSAVRGFFDFFSRPRA